MDALLLLQAHQVTAMCSAQHHGRQPVLRDHERSELQVHVRTLLTAVQVGRADGCPELCDREHMARMWTCLLACVGWLGDLQCLTAMIET